MKNKVFTIVLAFSLIFLASCGGNQPLKQGTDTVSKADATKDTLGIDTNKSAGKDSIGISSDTSKKTKPKTK